MSGELKFTIATVTFNAEKTLERTLQSVAGQDYPHIEHLIIDGASKDGTVGMLKRYKEENEQEAGMHTIQILSEPDRGLYDAMNKAIRLATGKYIVFLNSGDKLHEPTTVSKLADLLKESAQLPAVIYGETDLVDADGHFLSHRRLHAPETLNWKSFRNGMLVCHQSFYVRTDLARQEMYDLNYRFSADYDWCIRIMRRADSLQLPLLNSRIVLTDYLSEGLTTKNHRRSLLERLRLMAHHYGWTTALLRHLWFAVKPVR